MKSFEEFIFGSDVVDIDEAVKTWGNYGAKVSALVDKYKEHNTADTSYGMGNIRTSSSGKIEYAKTHIHYGGYNGMSASTVHHAVKIGSGFPKDKAEEFKKEYAKIQSKHMPETVMARDEKGEASPHKLRSHSSYGTNFSTLGVTLTK